MLTIQMYPTHPLPLPDSTLPLPLLLKQRTNCGRALWSISSLESKSISSLQFNLSNRVTENSTNFLWNLSNGIPHNTTLLYTQAPKCQRISIGLPIAKKERFYFLKCALVLNSMYGPPIDQSCRRSNYLQGETPKLAFTPIKKKEKKNTIGYIRRIRDILQ